MRFDFDYMQPGLTPIPNSEEELYEPVATKAGNGFALPNDVAEDFFNLPPSLSRSDPR